MLDDAQVDLLGDLDGWGEFLAKARTFASPKTIMEWVVVAEKLASQNNGKLPGPGWLQKNGYSALVQRLRKHPAAFRHIEKEKHITFSIGEWVTVAEELASENCGKLQQKQWLKKNGYSNLVGAMYKQPECFSHILQEKCNKTIEEWVNVAEKLAIENGGLLPCYTSLSRTGNVALQQAMRNNASIFSHIKQESRRGNLIDYVFLAERLAKDNGGVLPPKKELVKINAGLVVAIRNHPGDFTHIRQKIMRQTVDWHVSLAERIAKDHGGTLPMYQWLRKNGHEALALCMTRHRNRFGHIKQDKITRSSLSDAVYSAELLAKKHGGVLPSSGWLSRHGRYHIVNRMKGESKIAFAHIKQDRKVMSLSERVVEAEELSRVNGGKMPPWCRLNKALQMALCKHPDAFAHLEREKLR